MAGLRSDVDVVAELRRRLGHPLDPEIVGRLYGEGYIEDVLMEVRSGVAADESMQGLREHYRELHGTKPRAVRTLVEREAADARTLALSRIFAIDAGRDPDVRAFRGVVLKGRLLSRKEVPAWVEAQRSRDGPPALWGRVPIARDGTALARRTSARAADLLAYLGPGSPHSMVIGVPLGGPLRMLKDLAGRLQARYGWLESEASTFVLTDLVPRLSHRASVQERSRWSAAGRIVLDVPITAPARQVLQLYRRARASAVGQGRRRRDLSTVRADLAVFAFEHGQGHSWAEAMRRWNRGPGGRQHRYEDVRAFAKACHEAFQAVSGEGLPWGERGPGATPEVV